MRVGTTEVIAYFSDDTCASSPYGTKKSTIPFSNCSVGREYYSSSVMAECLTTTVSRRCFAGSETVTLPSGQQALIAQIAPGDLVLASDEHGMTSFAEASESAIDHVLWEYKSLHTTFSNLILSNLPTPSPGGVCSACSQQGCCDVPPHQHCQWS